MSTIGQFQHYLNQLAAWAYPQYSARMMNLCGPKHISNYLDHDRVSSGAKAKMIRVQYHYIWKLWEAYPIGRSDGLYNPATRSEPLTSQEKVESYPAEVWYYYEEQ